MRHGTLPRSRTFGGKSSYRQARIEAIVALPAGQGLIRGSIRQVAVFEEAAGGEELGVEKSAAGGATHEIVREQRELYVEQGTFADATDDGGHAISGVDVAARLRAILLVEDNDRMTHGAGERGELGINLEIAVGFANFVERSDFFQADGNAFEVAVDDRHAIAVGAEAEAGVHEARAIPLAEELLRFGFHFFFFAADEGNDVALDVHRGDAGITGAGDGLKSDDENLLEAERVGERFQYQNKAGRGTVRIGDDETGVVTAIFLLQRNGVEMRGVDFGNEQRNVRIHAVIPRVADDGIAGAGEIFFGGAGDRRIERGENEVAIEIGLEPLDDESAGGLGDRRFEMPLDGFGVGFAGRTLGGSDFGEGKPRMIGQQIHEALADDARGAQDASAPLLLSALCGGAFHSCRRRLRWLIRLHVGVTSLERL